METKNPIKSENTESTVLKSKSAAVAAAAGAGAAGVAAKTRPSLWKSVLVGGVPGIMIGASGHEYVSERIDEVEDSENPEMLETPGGEESVSGGHAATTVSSEILEAHSVSDDMSFNEAFASARAEVGATGAFVWHGNVYSTYRADDPEWMEMSSEDRMAHSEQILSQVHASPYTPGENEPVIQVDPAHADDQDVALVQDDEDVDSEVDVHIVGVGTIATEEAGDIPVAYGEVDGMNSMFVDTDGDGEVDLVVLDLDQNGVATMDEMLDASGAGIMMDDLAAQADINNAQMMDDNLYADMPDYTNDADMGSLV